MENIQNRIESFDNCKFLEVSKHELSRCGFYFIGPLDMVKCFSCGVEVGLWDSSEDIFDVHCRWRPNCKFLSEMACGVCMCGSKSILFLPCAHVSTCRECTKKIDCCPICRGQITLKMQVYIS